MTEKQMNRALAYFAASKYFPAFEEFIRQKKIALALQLSGTDLSVPGNGQKIQGGIAELSSLLVELEEKKEGLKSFDPDDNDTEDEV